MNVQERQIRTELLDRANSLETVRSLSDDFHLGKGLEQETELIPRQLFIVCYDSPDGHAQLACKLLRSISGISRRARAPRPDRFER